MTHPKELQIKDFTYHLPDERIARFPLENRDASKLLVYQHDQIESSTYASLTEFLPSGSMLVFNDSRVVQARLLFQKQTGALIEVFCLEPADEYPNISTAMAEVGVVRWKCLIGGASKWKHGLVLEKELQVTHTSILLRASIAERLPDCFVVAFEWEPKDLSFSQILEVAGSMPLPPYLHRPVETSDRERYQTIYAKHEGSVAAPTAGLHFTEAIFDSLEQKGISREFVTLHVSAGTFKPVSASRIADHLMHAEFIDVDRDTITKIIDRVVEGVIAVGTTSLRTLESLYWIGVKLGSGFADPEALAVAQWDPYELHSDVPAKESLQRVVDWMERKNVKRLITKTSILIAPGYKLRVAKALITNFHQPQSTLLLLIAAITGERWKHLYNYAFENDFRFLSYGDGCLLYPTETLG
ncbi:S-adenosylmethionine:tRNA ribosyltransferase-isomerase [Segetibacter sp. 3557_3]|uniref:S-adenosylmethionine:tRNA ribosyltransferase-isomerase n=1 Tax=Segetibacter sp. 3557_3 TaxID=2547429 RepID=UPI00105848A2|nr:S-adenosylmethionine:tRNA ribosyltransferase-isomerase [Segetibacter sp. 3557_3]TDH22993.1 S-adenosylmethionine:tRNA ribosyltransferase-isomerase [Segetibacter sp. 3557_3]